MKKGFSQLYVATERTSMDVQRAIIAQKVQVFLLVMTCCQIRPKQNKNIHSNNSKKFGVHKATIYRWLKKIEQNGNCDRKSGSGTGKSTDLTVSTRRVFFLINSVKTGNENFHVLSHN